MFYEVKVKRPGGIFWRRFKRVKGDLAYESRNGTPLPVRVLILADETRVEIPMSWIIVFSPARFVATHREIEREAGQKIPLASDAVS
jgi:hypothetical protein